MSKQKKNRDRPSLVVNSKAKHNYNLGEKFEAGIVLVGTEVKSIRNGNVQISESFARIVKNELFLYNAHISEYKFGGDHNHETQRPRKLLLNRRELEKLRLEVDAAGKTIVPLRFYYKEALVKCELAVATGKNHADKRQDLKKKVAQREADQALKNSLRK